MVDIRGELKKSIFCLNILLFFYSGFASIYANNIFWGEKNHPFDLQISFDVDMETRENGEQIIGLKRQPYPVSFDESLDTLQISFDKKSRILRSGEILKADYKVRMFDDSIGEAASFDQPLHEMWVAPADFLFLNQDKNTGDFSVYFRIRPYQMKRRMDVLQKVGLFEGRKQGLFCGWEDGKLFYEFFNFFWNKDIPIPDLRISTRDTFQENRFYAVMLVYRQSDGSLSLYLDGVEQEKIYLTTDFSPRGVILIPKFHKWDRSPIVIGKNYLGALDDVIFSNHTLSPEIISGKFNKVEKRGPHYYQVPGIAVSNRIDFAASQTKIEKMKYTIRKPPGTDVKFFYRYSDSSFPADLDEYNLPFIQWSSEKLSNVKAKYFQWKAELYSDESGELSPQISKVNLQYTVNFGPMPPKEISVLDVKEDEVTLEFLRSLEMDVVDGGRYHIYYGLKPYQPLGAIKYKSFKMSENGLSGVPITDEDKWETDDQRYQNRIKISISNEMIISNFSYFKQFPELLYSYSLLQKNIPYYFWVTACDHQWSEKITHSDHESKPSPYVVIRFR